MYLLQLVNSLPNNYAEHLLAKTLLGRNGPLQYAEHLATSKSIVRQEWPTGLSWEVPCEAYVGSRSDVYSQ